MYYKEIFMKKTIAILIILFSVISIFLSCSSGPKSSELVKLERQQRAYERYMREHSTKDKDELLKPGIYSYKKNIWVVISVSDTGVDSYPELACQKLLNSVIAYDILDKNEISKEEYSALVLEFEEAGFIEGDITNIIQVRIPEKRFAKFRKTYAKD
jgi:hypothetical protein